MEERLVLPRRWGWNVSGTRSLESRPPNMQIMTARGRALHQLLTFISSSVFILPTCGLLHPPTTTPSASSPPMSRAHGGHRQSSCTRSRRAHPLLPEVEQDGRARWSSSHEDVAERLGDRSAGITRPRPLFSHIRSRAATCKTSCAVLRKRPWKELHVEVCARSSSSVRLASSSLVHDGGGRYCLVSIASAPRSGIARSPCARPVVPDVLA
ncbi:hypothetical protein GY45DRAFT_649070 [Cubamyces sp. BRFM 1775]|nr:hypothetical protein GY45DRAFT_649070 [Cubamyces sp. BRFM 1775]